MKMNELPWVHSAKHLGNYLSTKISNATRSSYTSSSLLRKMGMLFDSVHRIEQQFGSYHPELVMKLIGIYFTSLYGSSLWELYLRKFQNLVRSWNTVTKLVWKLPHATHTILLEYLS